MMLGREGRKGRGENTTAPLIRKRRGGKKSTFSRIYLSLCPKGGKGGGGRGVNPSIRRKRKGGKERREPGVSASMINLVRPAGKGGKGEN